jgi:hypothetical protein
MRKTGGPGLGRSGRGVLFLECNVREDHLYNPRMPNNCKFCFVLKARGETAEIEIQPGNENQDNNFWPVQYLTGARSTIC